MKVKLSIFLVLNFVVSCGQSIYFVGYGCSTGKPSEKNLYADIAAALAALRSRYQMPLNQIILYGQSIGIFCPTHFKITFSHFIYFVFLYRNIY